MKIAIVAAGFTPSEADGLRRAMATFRKTGTIHHFEEKMIGGMVARGYDADFAKRCFRQIEGFGDYGFPESHAASFALLVYVSAWLKCHYPDVFAAALLNSQPMGFYAPAQIVRDAREHGVEVRGPDINHSDWDHTLEPVAPSAGHALRLGLRQVKGLKEEAGQAIVAARDPARDPACEGGYVSVEALWRRARVTTAALTTLADADAFASLGLDRRGALWAIRALGHNGRETAQGLPLFAAAGNRHATPPANDGAADDEAAALPIESAGEAVANDYTALRLSLKHHPLALLRETMNGFGVAPSETLIERANGAAVTVAGLVLVRQRPGSASGVIFITLEDESGVANVIVWPKTYERFRKVVLSARLLRIDGTLQREGIVTHVIARRIIDMSDHLDALGTGEDIAPRPFSNQVARADEVKNGPDCGPADPGVIGKRVRRVAPANPRRHPRNNHIRIASRDFH